MRSVTCQVFALLLCVAMVTEAAAEVVWDEASMGDLSNDNTEPTNLQIFMPGAGGSLRSNSVLGETDSGAADIFTFEIAGGTQLSELKLTRYENGDNAMFVAIAEGTEFPHDYFEINDPNFDGYTLWLGGSTVGPNDVTANRNLLERLGSIGIGSGFTPPLGEGKYTFYIQQTGPQNLYTFDFNVEAVSAVPEPATTGMLSAGLLGVFGYRRWKRKRSKASA